VWGQVFIGGWGMKFEILCNFFVAQTIKNVNFNG
jgi:hypothetical protein